MSNVGRETAAQVAVAQWPGLLEDGRAEPGPGDGRRRPASRCQGRELRPAGPDSPSALVSAALLAVCGPLAAVLIYVRVNQRSVIFRADEPRESRPQEVGDDDAPIDLRLTGHLRLNDGRPKHFVEVPATAMVDNRGHVVIGAYLDTSLYLFGWRVRERNGFWSVVVPPVGIATITRGDLAFGAAVRPAAKLRLGGSRAQTITLSVGGQTQRERLLRGLAQQYKTRVRSAA